MTPAAPAARLPVVTLLGVPNAGKSTLFNRLVEERRSLVTDVPGTTRDRLYARLRLGGKLCLLCDTGGVADLAAGGLQEEIRRQTFVAVEEASVVVLVLDGRAGLTAGDLDLAARLRPIADRVVLVWNKVDVPGPALESNEAYRLGLGEPVPISAEHGLGIADLVASVASRLPEIPGSTEPGPEDEVRIAIVGRPNVGKSSLLNRLCGGVRATVSEIPGTTRDAVDVEVRRRGGLYRFVDTAGIRRLARVGGVVERLGIQAARRAIARADVVLVLFDAFEGLVSQDLAVAGIAEQSGRGVVIVANKWDLVPDPAEREKRLRSEWAQRFRFARHAPFITVSALEGRRLPALFVLIDRIAKAGEVLIPTPRLNRFLEEFRAVAPAGGGGQGPKLRYMTQTGSRPPTFLVFGPAVDRLHVSEVRRLENRLREAFDLGPVPIRIRFRKEARSGGGRRPARQT